MKKEFRKATKKEVEQIEREQDARSEGFREGWNAAIDAMNEAMPGLMKLPKRK